MKTMCPPGYHRNGFVATHALRHMMYGYRGSLMTIEAKINPNCLNRSSLRFPHTHCYSDETDSGKQKSHPAKKREKKKLQKNQPTNQNKTGQVISCLMFS